MQICSFRMDDITPDMNWDLFYKMKSIFDKYEIKPLIGVVPDNRDPKLSIDEFNPDFWNVIRELQKEGWTIAQHGYQHIYDSQDSGILKLRNKSEFAGLSYLLQTEKIQKGKQILQKEGICANVFMAPGHTFDKITLRVLRENNFIYITDGYSNCCYEKMQMIHIPCRKSMPKLENGIDTICIHSNSLEWKTIQYFNEFIKNNRDHIVNFNELQGQKIYKSSIRIFMEEKRNLLWRKIKVKVSANEILHQFLLETEEEKKSKQILNRILYAPKIICSLVAEKMRKKSGKKYGNFKKIKESSIKETKK